MLVYLFGTAWLLILHDPFPHVQANQKNAEALFIFGDSYADTGNHDPLNSAVNVPWRKPYGLTWPGRPSGRFSNGRVLTDFVAAHMGIQTPVTYRVVQNESARHIDNRRVKAACARGINFAYGGSGVFPTFGPQFITISAQINQLRAFVNKGLVSISDMSTALLVVAGNDYTIYGLQPQKEGIDIFTGKVVSAMVGCLEVLHEMGFKRLLVTNLEPFGCFPGVSNFSACNTTDNQESALHNKLLASEIPKLKGKLPNADIVSLDLEHAFSLSLQGPFNHSRSQWKSCCRARGKDGGCAVVGSKGKPLYYVCSKPGKAFYWDSVHPTDSGWEAVATTLFHR